MHCVCVRKCTVHCLRGAWLHEAMLCHWGEQPGRGDRWACPEFGATFAPRQVPVGAWHEVKGEAMAVNEAPYAGAVEMPVRPEGARRWLEADVVVMRMYCSAHTGNEVSSCVGGAAERL